MADTAETLRDVVVVGGGAAGLSAALALARARRAVTVVDAGEPRNGPANAARVAMRINTDLVFEDTGHTVARHRVLAAAEMTR